MAHPWKNTETKKGKAMENKKQYVTPDLEVITFSSEDIILTSPGDGTTLPEIPFW